MNKYLEKIASSDTEYSGPSNWQTAGLTAAGLGGATGLLGYGTNIENAVDKARASGHGNWGKVKSLSAAAGRYRTAANTLAAASLATPAAVALHRQYQDYKSGNKDPHYGRGALIGASMIAAGAPAFGATLFELASGTAAGLGAVGLNHAHNKYMDKIASKQSDLEANEAFQKMKAQRGKVPSEQKGPLPGTPEKRPIKTIGAEQGRANIEAELARQKQVEAERVANRPLNKPKAMSLKARRDAEHEARMTQPKEVPAARPPVADGRNLAPARESLSEKIRARKAQAAIDNKPMNKPDNVALRMRRDAEHEARMTQPREVPAARPPVADGRNLTAGRERMKEQRLARKAQAAQPAAPVATPHVTPTPATAAAEDTATRTAKMLAKYKKPALALGALGLAGYALSGRNTDTELHNQ